MNACASVCVRVCAGKQFTTAASNTHCPNDMYASCMLPVEPGQQNPHIHTPLLALWGRCGKQSLRHHHGHAVQLPAAHTDRVQDLMLSLPTTLQCKKWGLFSACSGS